MKCTIILHNIKEVIELEYESYEDFDKVIIIKREEKNLK